MNSLIKTSIALLLIILTSLPSLASENSRSNPAVSLRDEDSLIALRVISKKEGLNTADLEKYKLMSEHSRTLARTEAAGASSTTKTVLIVVGVVVVVLVVVAASSYHPVGKISFANPS